MSKSNAVKLKSNGRIGYVLPYSGTGAPTFPEVTGVMRGPATDYRRVVFPSDQPNWKTSTQKAVIQIVHISKLTEVTE